ncbi:MAG: DUF4340 domain-containing protein [Verrucomicrobiota bacterium]|nr:DUF4340 domain-containing protein [Verrucomicrobiota bacterium]
MRTKITLVLIFLNVVLFAFILYIEPHFSAEDSFNEMSRRILGPEAANITALEISNRRSGQTFRLEKHGDSWLLSKPSGWPANPNAVDRILTQLQTTEHEASFLVSDLAKNGQTLADYGLDQPQLTVTFTSGADNEAGGKNYTLLIGANTRIGNRLYVLSPDGKRIHVVSQNLAESLTLPLDQLRSDTLFTIPVFEASALGIQTAGPPIRIHREGARWSFESPILARASKIETELAISDLDTLQAQSFVESPEADPDRTGLSAPSLRLTLDGNNRRETLLLGRTAPKPKDTKPSAETPFYAKMDDKPAVFVVSFPNELLDNLTNAQVTLRETHFLDFDPAEVTALNLRAPNFPDLTLQRLESPTTAKDGSTWQIVRHSNNHGPQTQPADLSVVQRLLENLSLLSAKKFVSDAPSAADLETWGFNRPEREITVTLAPAGSPNAKSATLVLQLGLGTDARVYARVAGADSVYAVDSTILAATPVLPRAYRDRLLRALPDGAQITGLKLTRLSDQTVFYEKTLAAPTENQTKPPAWDAAWKAALAAEPADRRQAVLTILASLRDLRVKSYVLDEFAQNVTVAGANRPWSYRLDATIALAAASGAGAPATTTTTQLFFTERVGGGTQLGGSPEFGVIFEAEQPLLDALFTLTSPLQPAAENPKPPVPAENPNHKSQTPK